MFLKTLHNIFYFTEWYSKQFNFFCYGHQLQHSAVDVMETNETKSRMNVNPKDNPRKKVHYHFYKEAVLTDTLLINRLD